MRFNISKEKKLTWTLVTCIMRSLCVTSILMVFDLHIDNRFSVNLFITIVGSIWAFGPLTMGLIDYVKPLFAKGEQHDA